MSIANEASDSESIPLAFGQEVRRRREHLGLSQEGFAEIVGLHRTYVSSVERGQRNVGLENIVRLAKALGVHPGELFGPPS